MYLPTAILTHISSKKSFNKYLNILFLYIRTQDKENIFAFSRKIHKNIFISA